MTQIHSTAIVSTSAELGEDVVIGAYCVVGPHVKIGRGTRLHNHVTIAGHTRIGSGNVIYPQAILGLEPQDLKYHGEAAELVIGDGNVIRELVTMHIGTENGGNVTRIGNHNLIMVSCHIAHDCVLGDHIIMANGVSLAGHVVVEDHANIGGLAGVHHFVTFGKHCFMGGMARVSKDVPPFMIGEGNPVEMRSINVIGLERAGISEVSISRLKHAHQLLYRPKGSDPSTQAERLALLAGLYPEDEQVGYLVDFLKKSHENSFGRYRESLRKDPRHRRPADAVAGKK